MTVSIRLEADSRSLELSLKRTEEGLRRLKNEFKELGRTGAETNKIDFTEAARKVERQFHEFISLNDSLRRRLERSGQTGRSPLEIDWNRMGYLDQRTQEANRQRTMGYAIQGTGIEMPAGGGGEGGGGGMGGGHRGGIIGGIAGGVWQGAKFGLGMLGIQTGMGFISEMFSGARNTAKAADFFARRTTETGEKFGDLRDRLTALGNNLQLSNQESVKLAASFQNASNELDPTKAIAGARGAAGFARGFGLDPAQTAQSMGELQFMGVTGKGGMSNRQLALLVGKTISNGMLGGRAEQVISNLGQHVDAFVSRTLQAPQDVPQYLNFVEAMGKLANKGGYPGLAGPAGAGLIEQATQGLQTPGGGLGGQMLVMRALQESGLGGGSVWKMLYEKQKLTALSRLPNGKLAIEQYMDTAQRMAGGDDPNRAAIMAGAPIGMTGPQVTALNAVIAQARTQKGGVSAWQSRLKGAGVDLEKMNETGIAEIGKVMGANPDVLRKMAEERKIDVDRKLGTEELRNALIKNAADNGMYLNESNKTERLVIEALNAAENAVNGLLPILGALKDTIDNVTRTIQTVAHEWFPNLFKDLFAPAPGTQPPGPAKAFKPGTSQAPSTAPESGPYNILRNPEMLAYMGKLERERGIPPGVLAANAMVESGGNPTAKNTGSSATGAWQVIAATAKRTTPQLLGPGFDYRKDPVMEAEAIANLLADDYKRTGSWRAAIANLGPYGAHDPRGLASADRQLRDASKRSAAPPVPHYRGTKFMPDFDSTFTPLPVPENPLLTPETKIPAGNVDVTIHHRDAEGRTIAPPLTHKGVLNRKNPSGTVNIDSLFGVPNYPSTRIPALY